MICVWIAVTVISMGLLYVLAAIGCCTLAARGWRRRIDSKEIYLSLDETMAHRNPYIAKMLIDNTRCEYESITNE